MTKSLAIGQSVFFSDWRDGPAFRITQVNGSTVDLTTADGRVVLNDIPNELVEPVHLGHLTYGAKREFFNLVCGENTP